MALQLIFGTGVVGMDGMEFQDSESVTKLLLTLKELGINRLDTAARYPPFNPGRSELLLGAANALSDTFVVGLPSPPKQAPLSGSARINYMSTTQPFWKNSIARMDTGTSLPGTTMPSVRQGTDYLLPRC